MADDLDHLLARLAHGAPTPSLDGFEDEVLRGVAQRRESLRAAKALVPVGAASVALGLALGVAAGGMAAATTATAPDRLESFTGSARLAPSTLLDGAG